MEVMELADLRKAFMPSKHRYDNPHREAMQLRTLWTFDRPPEKSRDSQRIIQLLGEAKNLVETKDCPGAHRLLSKALLINPRLHKLYALRGDIFAQQGKLGSAIQNYEVARTMLRFDKKSANERSSYTKSLIDLYRKRGLLHYEQERFMEAASDYEQILVLKPFGVILNEIQDELLKTLRTMDKYEAFRYEWARFMKDADRPRASSLLTQHAEYKIFRRELSSARHILFEAIDLDPDNTLANELLQVIYDTGHHLIAFSIIWSIYGCHDKALMAAEKARECDPYNPGYTLLKTILLRLSGRLLEAAKWLESVDKGFHKLLEPSRDKKGSIMGNLTIEQTRVQLIKQWHLIRYDIAVDFMTENRYADAMTILQSSQLREQYAETNILLGDCMLRLGDTDDALRTYMNGLAMVSHLKTMDPGSRKYVHLLKRVTDILNEKCSGCVDERRSKDAIKIANDVTRILDGASGAPILGQSLGEALVCGARALYQREDQPRKSVVSSIAEGLKLARGADGYGLYRQVFDDVKLESIIDNFGTRRKLPKSLKLLMQYS